MQDRSEDQRDPLLAEHRWELFPDGLIVDLLPRVVVAVGAGGCDGVGGCVARDDACPVSTPWTR